MVLKDGGVSLVFMAMQFVVNDIFRGLRELFNLPWVMAGDFNEVFFLSEKEGGSDRFLPSMIRSRETIENCQLVDLRYDGPKLTWDNGQDDEDNIRERLDRMLGSEYWISLYPNFTIQVLNFYGSGHRALWLELVW